MILISFVRIRSFRVLPFGHGLFGEPRLIGSLHVLRDHAARHVASDCRAPHGRHAGGYRRPLAVVGLYRTHVRPRRRNVKLRPAVLRVRQAASPKLSTGLNASTFAPHTLLRYPSARATGRIVGLPGDEVQIRDGALCINGEPVPTFDAGTYSDAGDGISGPGRNVPMKREMLAKDHAVVVLGYRSNAIISSLYNTASFKVPPASYFVLGDNRENSIDSREQSPRIGVGFVPRANVLGKLAWTYWSSDRSRIGGNWIKRLWASRLPRHSGTNPLDTFYFAVQDLTDITDDRMAVDKVAPLAQFEETNQRVRLRCCRP